MFDENYPDEQIISDLASESEELNNRVFRFLYKNVYPAVYSFVRQNSGTKREADDVFQEAMIALYENIKQNRFRGESSINTYLYSTVRNIWFSRLKRDQRMVYMEDMTHTPDMKESNNVDQELKINMIINMLDELGVSCKSILKQYYFDNCSMKDIMEKMGFASMESAKSQKYKCMQKLISYLHNHPKLKEALKDCI